MDWISWGIVLALGFLAGTLATLLSPRWAAAWQAVARQLRSLAGRLLSLTRPHRNGAEPRRQSSARPAVTAGQVPGVAPARRAVEEAVVLIPDGRPWPLGSAVQLLELAWRWQVTHGINLPVRARQGEGAYVWRPPLPANTPAGDQSGAEAER